MSLPPFTEPHRSVERAAAVFWKPRKQICFKAGKQPLHVSPEGPGNQSRSKVSFILSPLSQIHVEEFPLSNLKRKPKTTAFHGGYEGKDLWPGNGPDPK